MVANVGMLAQPTGQAQVLAGAAKLPTNLYSHSDQIVYVWQDALSLGGLLKGNTGGSLATVFPITSLGKQLQQVAKIIKLRTTTGMARQVFFCSIGGFDTHSAQSWQQWNLLHQVGDAMAAFYATTQELGVANQVTAFTESEFGRSLQPSGTGSDYGWGSHHLVLGGAVKGGNLYGSFPSHVLGGPDDASNRGLLIPSTSLDQYGATLARWFGVDATGMARLHGAGYSPRRASNFLF